MSESLGEVSDRIIRGHTNSEGQWVTSPSLVRESILSALRNERERCAKLLESRADELQAEWDAPPSAKNGFIAMTADTPAGYATYYAMNQLRKLAVVLREGAHNGNQHTG